MPGRESTGHCNEVFRKFGKWEVACNEADAVSVRLPPMGSHLELLLHPARRGQKEITEPQHLPYPPAVVPEELKRAPHSSSVGALWSSSGELRYNNENLGVFMTCGGKQGYHSQVEFGTLGLFDF